MPEDEMVGRHHWLGHKFEQVPRVGDRQGNLACCSPWDCKESDRNEWLNWTELKLVIGFLPRRKQLLISWLQSPTAVILEPKKIKSVTVFIVSPSIYYEVMGPDAVTLMFLMFSFRSAFSLSFGAKSGLQPRRQHLRYLSVNCSK